MKDELELRGIDAIKSLALLDPSLRTEKMSKEELKASENTLTSDGFDTVLFSKIIGVEDKIAYKKDYKNYDKTYRRFKDNYFMYQDIFYNPE